MNTFLACGIIFLFALGSSRLLGRLRFPAVTSYLLLGILIGPHGFKLLPQNLIDSTSVIGYFVLGMVAFSLGANFFWKRFRVVGKSVISISCFEVAGAVVLVTGSLLLLGRPVSEAVVFGGIAAATAPMATFMIVREYKAKGPFTNTLLNVVAIDDSWGIIAFAIVMAIAKFHTHVLNIDHPVAFAFFNAFKEIFGAVVVGLILGILLSLLSRYIKNQTDLLIYTLGFILVTVGISIHPKVAVSPLLANMALGAFTLNITKSNRFFTVIRRVDWPLYLIFFVLCGASLQINLLEDLGMLAVVYVVARILGKYIGSYLGARIMHMDSKVKKYLGLGLIPQAGVALGFAIIAKTELPSLGNIIFTTIIATTILFEMIGPFCTKFALSKAEETNKI